MPSGQTTGSAGAASAGAASAGAASSAGGAACSAGGAACSAGAGSGCRGAVVQRAPARPEAASAGACSAGAGSAGAASAGRGLFSRRSSLLALGSLFGRYRHAGTLDQFLAFRTFRHRRSLGRSGTSAGGPPPSAGAAPSAGGVPSAGQHPPQEQRLPPAAWPHRPVAHPRRAVPAPPAALRPPARGSTASGGAARARVPRPRAPNTGMVAPSAWPWAWGRIGWPAPHPPPALRCWSAAG